MQVKKEIKKEVKKEAKKEVKEEMKKEVKEDTALRYRVSYSHPLISLSWPGFSASFLPRKPDIP